MLDIRRITVGAWQINCYVVSDENKRCILIDPGEDPAGIDEELIIPAGLTPIAMLATHGHLDHIGGARYFNEKYAIPLYVHADDVQLANHATYWAEVLRTPGITNPSQIVPYDSDSIAIENFAFDIVHTPGHTAGGCCLHLKDKASVFTGDTLFFHTIGRTDRPGLDSGGGHEVLVNAIKTRLFKLPGDTIVYPGHGIHTTIDHEREHNPALLFD